MDMLRSILKQKSFYVNAVKNMSNFSLKQGDNNKVFTK